MSEEEIRFLGIFPKSKDIIQMSEIYASAGKLFVSQQESLTLLTSLKKDGYLSGTPISGFAITDKAIASLQSDQEQTEKEETRDRKEEQVLDLTIDDLVDKIIDQPKYKNRLLRAEIISAVSALAAILTALLSARGC